jgi:hypothetical protein
MVPPAPPEAVMVVLPQKVPPPAAVVAAGMGLMVMVALSAVLHAPLQLFRARR